MKHFRTIAAVAITGLVGVLPAAAQGKSGTHGAGAATHGRPTTAGATTPQGKSADAGTRGKSADARPRGSDAKATKKPAGTAVTATNTAAGGNALATKIAANPNQLARVTGMLPQGMTLDQATAGFRNQGQFIAALNASKNQGVPFADLQKAMTVDGLSLGQAVRTLKAPASTTTTGTTTTTSSTTNAS